MKTRDKTVIPGLVKVGLVEAGLPGVLALRDIPKIQHKMGPLLFHALVISLSFPTA